MPKKTYRSKVDRNILLLLLVVPFTLVLANVAVTHAQPHWLALALRVIGTVVLLFVLWTLLDTVYTLDAGSLFVRSGPFRWIIALREIQSVTPTRDARSSPALSLDRLRIEYGKGRWILISPRDQTAFLQDLQRRIELHKEC